MTSKAEGILREIGLARISIVDENSPTPTGAQGVVINSKEHFPALMRKLEPLSRAGVVVMPADPDWVVSADLRSFDAMQCAWQTSAAANYVARCNLRGHYTEFGTYWGRSFFPNYFRFRHWLRGDFLAFDSFYGLSQPMEEEIESTGGDFRTGAYACNKESFRAIADLVQMPAEKLKVIPGFYSETLRDPNDYNLAPQSVSVCYIDCDLYEPTKEVLNFTAPLLENGALIYFDDWRLTRASPRVGERAAALEWLAQNPSFELIDFDREHWQNQWFIFQRR